ncbi:hypothetical protein OIE43_01800 [Streptomyces pseudovenezuelae]|uniref:Condensation domain-containing protein n=1 Tax=Streptomyces pseudovenezuelae TaxID=67350 RepID=A0ABZ1WNU2_9ACTN|nr:hypothetical protein [Streptomyces pseudovenezuelae]WUA93507.1 hypothetical protein OHO81_41930 [Streptomyces pseudovenezuelae]
MSTTVSDLLESARLPVAPRSGADVAAGLRRLAAEASRRTPTTEVTRAAQAGQRLAVVCRWVLNEPDAAAHVAKIAEGPDRGPLTEEELDVDGALVYACLLSLTGHPESAQFWWQLAAGAGSRAAAYCLHLHHLCVGESRRARHWFHQLTHSMADTAPPDAAFLDGLEIFARYVRANGSGAHAPTGRLESEVDRLAARTPHSSVIVARPDRQLVARLQEFSQGR